MPECSGDFQFQEQVTPKCVCPVFLGLQILECEASSDSCVSHCPVTWQFFIDMLFSSQEHFYNYKNYFWQSFTSLTGILSPFYFLLMYISCLNIKTCSRVWGNQQQHFQLFQQGKAKEHLNKEKKHSSSISI